MKSLKHYLLQRQHLVVLCLILLFALSLRLVHLTSNPIALNQDEAVNGYDAYTLGKTLADHHGNFLPPMLQSFDDWASPLLTYITVPFVQVLGLSVKTIRIVVVILGVGSIGLFYLFLRQISFKQNSALLGAFLLSIMPWHITYSRWAIPPSTVCFAILLFLVLFLWAVKQSKTKTKQLLFILPGIAAVALTYSYPTQKLFVPLFLIALVLIYLRKKFLGIAALLISYGIGVLPIYALTYLHPEKYNASFNALSILRTANPLKEFFVRYLEYFSPYFHFQAGDVDIMHHVPGVGISYDFLSLFFYVGIVLCVLGLLNKVEIGNISKQTYKLLLAWLLLFPVAASATTAHNMALRVVHGLPLVIIFFLVSYQYCEQHFQKYVVKILTGVIVVLGLVSVSGFMKIYLTDYPLISYKEFQYGIEDYTKYLSSHETDFDKVYIDNSINKPYIYFLFYSKYPPEKLNYSDPEKSSSKYVFSELPVFDQDDKNIVKDISFGSNVLYRIYKNDRVWFVKKM